MAFIVEDGTGLSNANSLASVQEFKDYYTDRGVDLTEFTDEDIQVLLIKGSDYLVQKTSEMFQGQPLKDTQALPFPRATNKGNIFPIKVKYAVIVLALKANTTILFEDSTKPVKREKIGDLEVEYEEYSCGETVYNEVMGYLKPYFGEAGITIKRC